MLKQYAESIRWQPQAQPPTTDRHIDCNVECKIP